MCWSHIAIHFSTATPALPSPFNPSLPYCYPLLNRHSRAGGSPVALQRLVCVSGCSEKALSRTGSPAFAEDDGVEGRWFFLFLWRMTNKPSLPRTRESSGAQAPIADGYAAMREGASSSSADKPINAGYGSVITNTGISGRYCVNRPFCSKRCRKPEWLM